MSLLHREGRLVDPNLVIFGEILVEAVICYPSGIFIQKRNNNKCEYTRTPQV
jgi:hypothetical protein